MYLFKKDIRDNITDLQKEYNFTAKEAVVIAVQMEHNKLLEEQNKLLKQAHVLNENYPSALESIAIQLGMNENRHNTNIINTLDEIGTNLQDIAEKLSK